MAGKIVAIHIAAARGEEMQSPAEVELLAGVGIRGDRKAIQPDDHPLKQRADRQLTLIEIEKIDAFNEEFTRAYSSADFRRNLVTEGISLNELVGKEFTIAGVRARGIQLCQPCSYLAKRLDRSILGGLLNRGGLRAEILVGGEVAVGDLIEVSEEAS